MIHKLIPVFHSEYNMLQIVVKHETYDEEEKTGYYMYANLIKIVEGDNPSLEECKTHGRQLIKKAKKESLYDDTSLKSIVKEYRDSINNIFNLSLLERDF